MDINNQSNPQEVQSVPTEVVAPSKPKRFKKRQLSLKRAVKAQKYKTVAMLTGDLSEAARALGIPYQTLYTSARKHGWISDFKNRNANLLQKKLKQVQEDSLGEPMIKAWRTSQLHRALKNSEKIDKIYERVEDPSQINQLAKALDSEASRGDKALGLDRKDSATVNTMVQVNLHTS